MKPLTAESPFLPGTHKQYAWDSTSLGWLKTCPRLYYYTMIEGWRSPHESVHLRFGSLYHSALERYDRFRFEGMDHDNAQAEVLLETLRATWDEGAPWESQHDKKTRFTLLRSIAWYLEEFKEDHAKTIRLANGLPGVELSFGFEINKDIVLSGHLDRVVEYQDGTYVMDRKTTTSTISPYYFTRYSPDNQMSLYTLAGQIIHGSPVRGVIIDAAQIAVGFTRFQRGMVYRTPRQLDEWLDDTVHLIAQAHSYADAEYWPMNDKSCHHYGGCPFVPICSRDPGVRKQFLETLFVKDHWNPLEVR